MPETPTGSPFVAIRSAASIEVFGVGPKIAGRQPIMKLEDSRRGPTLQ
jgi:hypothetical protein